MLPGNITTVWVRGTYLTDTGAPLAGSVRFIRSTKALIDLDVDTILASRVRVADLDQYGKFVTELIASDDPDLIPTGFTYIVEDPLGRQFPMLVPSASPVVSEPSDPLYGLRVIELADVVPAASASGGTVQLVTGPTGPPGDAGPEGPTGPAGSLTVTFTAGAALSGHRMVTRSSDDSVVYADNSDPNHLAAPLWMTLGAASDGAAIECLAGGVVDEPSWSWTPGPLYLGATGHLTQTPPTASGAVFLTQIGYATSATSIVLDRQPSIRLA